MFDSTQYICFFPQLIGTTYECIWDIICFNLEKASKTNREPLDRKIQLSKKTFSVQRASLTEEILYCFKFKINY